VARSGNRKSSINDGLFSSIMAGEYGRPLRTCKGFYQAPNG
jgi:hypothetical protein